MKPPFEDETVSGDVAVANMLFMQKIDPRPITAEKYATRFMRKLKIAGFLPDNITEGEFQHLENTLRNWIAEAVRDDRFDRFMAS